MSEKRFIDGGQECIEDQFLIDTLTDEYYWIDNGLDDIINMLNALHEENIRLKRDFDSCSHNWGIMYDEAKEKVEKLTEENWELEQENERLENKLWNCQNVR